MMNKEEARKIILEEANKFTTKRLVTLSMRNINEAVAIVRFQGVVDAATLEAAGFNATKRR